jgi:hypothetical protein
VGSPQAGPKIAAILSVVERPEWTKAARQVVIELRLGTLLRSSSRLRLSTLCLS